ncbi:acyltransferase [Parabacteroides faecis]|uniref:Acetyltransferase-like isoleucine patch superfamily enzyme n=1 Tax=Parabacteroides faecis TaxID=1217282 RepID=A0ABR6KJ46_9BACT|nr:MULTISPECIES: acyltransferase [Parabacteroides]MBB4621540.1 acetyltransferase-like isoleucine patch superfamily enzyme [Parabacteroides faecis]MBC8618076.1 acyltransferase [Parabacteroides faecis]RHR99179.1 acyltransferase [Parabacteroides sp. AF14-59]UVQ48391.1 acyltransferase [Parabacteroides faecis]GGJ86248.1 acetyltransferase [Parabacteroides faecis]
MNNSLKQKIKQNETLKHFVLFLISSPKNPKPRFWVKWFVNPFFHKKGKGATIRKSKSRIDVFPWNQFTVGTNTLIEDFTTINNGAGDVIIGNNARIGIGSVVIGPVKLGNKVGLGQHVFISGFNHGYEDGNHDSNEQPLVKKDVIIEDDSHIGANSVIVAGVHIGKRCQIGAGSVVTKNIPDYSVAVGNPAKVIKHFDSQLNKWINTEK